MRTKQKRYMYAGFCQYNDALVYEQYGHWHFDARTGKLYPKPSWYKSVLAEAKELMKILKPPNIVVEIIEQKEVEHPLWPNHKISTTYKFIDLNNPFLTDNNAVFTKTKHGGVAYANKQLATSKRLMEGSINALLVTKETGIACLPDWNKNRLDDFGYKKDGQGIISTKVPRAHEVIKLAVLD